ncbi:MAG: MBL fold metallo-hydrolase [Burkholderiales bacterium]|nr:MBL fold metallo-hydrolase [Burkholderiales bacterium]
MTKAFASKNDLGPKTITFEQISEHGWAYTAEGDPNSGVIIGDDGVMVVDATATPVMAQDLIARIRKVTDKPIRYVTLSHYHAVRVLGASAFKAEQVIASRPTYELIVERGKEDWQSEYERFPRLFQAADSVPGLTWPTMVFERQMTVYMGKLEVQLIQIGPGHTRGDTIAWLPGERTLFSGDLVEFNAGIYTGDAQLEEWPDTLDKLRALKPKALVPGRGPALKSEADSVKAIDFTQNFVRQLLACAREGVKAGKSLKETYAATRARLDPVYGSFPIYEHCMPFDVSRAFDEASGIKNPRIWTAERDMEMWNSIA